MAHFLGLYRSGALRVKYKGAWVPLFVAYDAMCSWGKHVADRYYLNPELREAEDLMNDFVKLIGAAHVYNHVDNCLYIFSPFYVPHAGHLYGETSEQTWSYTNRFGAIIAQMNLNHGHEIYFHVAMDWNWRKTIAIREFSSTFVGPV